MYGDDGKFRATEKVILVTTCIVGCDYSRDSSYSMLICIKERSYNYQFTFQLCIGLDNMHHVQTALADMPQKLGLQLFYSWLQKEQGIGEKASLLVCLCNCTLTEKRIAPTTHHSAVQNSQMQKSVSRSVHVQSQSLNYNYAKVLMHHK